MNRFQLNKTDFGSKKRDIEKAKAGNKEAIHKLYEAYAVAMLNTAFRILNNKADAEDVLHDCFIRAMSNLSQFNYQSTFGAWFKRIVINHSVDLLKKRKRLVFKDTEKETTRVMAFDNELDLKSKLDVLYKALHQLPDGYRTVLSLYMLEGYDHSEISKILNIEISTSISQLSRAKKKLKALTMK